MYYIQIQSKYLHTEHTYKHKHANERRNWHILAITHCHKNSTIAHFITHTPSGMQWRTLNSL